MKRLIKANQGTVIENVLAQGTAINPAQNSYETIKKLSRNNVASSWKILMSSTKGNIVPGGPL